LFGTDSEEMKLVREELGDLPVAGFYANGEISHTRLYGYTGVLTVFLEPE
jgi:small ligand-binding sensory domain FIST